MIGPSPDFAGNLNAAPECVTKVDCSNTTGSTSSEVTYGRPETGQLVSTEPPSQLAQDKVD